MTANAIYYESSEKLSTKWIEKNSESHDFKDGKGKIVLKDSVEEIGGGAFENCSLESIVIPDSVTEIGELAFAWCADLTSILIPDSVTEIGSKAFYGCTELKLITVDPKNPVFDSRENCNAIIETETDMLIAGCQSTTIPASVKKIGNYAFAGCTGLGTIVIHDYVTEIGESAFEGCEALTSIVIPDSVTEIKYCAFRGCKNLSSIVIPDSVTEIDDLAFHGCDELPERTKKLLRSRYNYEF